MSGLSIPYAFDEVGNVLFAESARRDTDAFCPACGGALLLRAGDIRRRHFAHKVDTQCSPESVRHKVAKRAIRHAMDGTSPITIVMPCSGCRNQHSVSIPPGIFDHGAEEVRVGHFWCDVVGYRGDNTPALAVEVYATHHMGEHKESSLPLHWIEVDADEIIENPLIWRALKCRMKDTFCDSCASIRDAIHQWGIDPNSYVLAGSNMRSPFVATMSECWRCKASIPVFWWDGVPYCRDEPPLPRPWTIQNRFSATLGDKYWCNTCPKCHSIQGDHFINYDAIRFAHDPSSFVSVSVMISPEEFIQRMTP